jgi:site-specific recombinase XerD
MSELDPLGPQDGLTLYLQSRENELADATYRTHKGRLSDFINWCEQNNIENLNTLTGRKIQRYRIAKTEDMKPITVKSYLDTLRVFARFLVTIDAVPEHPPDKIQSTEVKREDEARTAHIDSETAEDILAHLRTYEYASTQHVIFRLLWRTGMR